MISVACFEVGTGQPRGHYTLVFLRIYQPEQAAAVAAPAVLLPVFKEAIGEFALVMIDSGRGDGLLADGVAEGFQENAEDDIHSFKSFCVLRSQRSCRVRVR
ncbi:hypothetical protein D3C72_1846250 [compost metagenome]